MIVDTEYSRDRPYAFTSVLVENHSRSGLRHPDVIFDQSGIFEG